MRLPLSVVLGALLGLSQSNILQRQGLLPNALESSSAHAAAAPTATDAPTLSPTGGDSSSSSSSTSSSSSSSSISSSSSSSSSSSDTTVTETRTVTGTGGGSTVTKQATAYSTTFTTIFATSTIFVTSTVTSNNEDTATSTIWSTTTVTINKRALIPELPPATAPARVDAVPTAAAQPEYGYGRRGLGKRATVTVTTTVTVGRGGAATTITNTVTRGVAVATSTVTTITNVITETEQANAKTTVTVTSLLTVSTTIVNTGVTQTIAAPPAGDNTAGAGAGSNSDSGSGSPSSGLSTGAKVGIGIGAGVGGLAVLAGILWLILRRRNRDFSSDPDDMVGSSEVPVGKSGHIPPMSGHAAAVTGLGASRLAGKPEGYRGTAMGDGRAGFAKPDPLGSTYSNGSAPTTVSPLLSGTSPNGGPTIPNIPEMGPGAHAEPTPAAELGNDGGAGSKWYDPNATEIDSHPILSHQSGPVYEMPVQSYR